MTKYLFRIILLSGTFLILTEATGHSRCFSWCGDIPVSSPTTSRQSISAPNSRSATPVRDETPARRGTPTRHGTPARSEEENAPERGRSKKPPSLRRYKSDISDALTALETEPVRGQEGASSSSKPPRKSLSIPVSEETSSRREAKGHRRAPSSPAAVRLVDQWAAREVPIAATPDPSWIVDLGWRDTFGKHIHSCTGSLVRLEDGSDDTTIVITSLGCIANIASATGDVWRRQAKVKDVGTIPIKALYPSKEYREGGMTAGVTVAHVGLIELAVSVSKELAVSLPSFDNSYNADGFTAGWRREGLLHWYYLETEVATRRLDYIQMMAPDECDRINQDYYSRFMLNPGRVFCVKVKDGSIPCETGSPHYVKSNGKRILVDTLLAVYSHFIEKMNAYVYVNIFKPETVTEIYSAVKPEQWDAWTKYGQ